MPYISKIDWMHWRFGVTHGHKCVECDHFSYGRYHDTILKKCEVYGRTHSEATDWKNSCLACGLFNKPYDGIEQIEFVKRQAWDKQDVEQIDGQMTL